MNESIAQSQGDVAKTGRGRYLHLVAFTSGAVVMALELLGTRMLAPICGTSIHVWAAMITVTLASVAVGYHHGGKSADEVEDTRPLEHLLMAAAVGIAVTSGCSRFFLLLLAPIDLRLAALLGSLLLFAFPLACLGAVMPICVKLATPEVGRIGRSVGSLYVASTLGSCVGTLVTGFVLIPYIGTQVSTALLTTFLVSIGCIHIARKPWSQVLAIAAFVPLGVACIFPMFMRPREKHRNPTCRDQRKQIGLAVQMYRDTYEASRSSPGSNQRLMPGAIQSGLRLFRRDSLCGRLEVWTTDKQRLLLVDGMLQTAMPSDPSAVAERNHLFPEHYWVELLPYFRPKARNALLIGLGGGLLPQVLRSYGIETEAVEVDPVVVEVARRYFGYAGPATIDDGRHFLSTSRQHYNFIILDAFTGDHPPSHLLTIESLREAKRLLKEDGILAINIADVPKAGRILSALENTLSPLFDNCMQLGTDVSNRVQLFTMFVTEGSLAPQPVSMGPHVRPTTEDLQRITPFIQQRTGIGLSTVLRDDRNPFDILYAPVALEWRKATADLVGY